MVKINITLTVIMVSFFLSGCSATKENQVSNFDSTSSSETPASVEFGSIGPISKSGSSAALVSSQSGEKILIAKEYRHKVFDRYFMTTRSADQKIVEPGGILGADWESTSNTYSVYESQVVGSSPLCRFYIPAAKTHFYTADVDECNLLKKDLDVRDEGIEGYVVNIGSASSCPGSTKPVYGAFNNSSNNEQKRHRYSANPSVISNLVSKSWQNEGILFCADDVFIAFAPPPVENPPTNSCTKPERFSNSTRDICDDFGPLPEDVAQYCACRYSSPPPVGVRCVFNQTSLAEGDTALAFETATVASGSECRSEVRVCQRDGTMSGSYNFGTCSQGTAPPAEPPPDVGNADSSMCPSDFLFYDWGMMNGSTRYTGTSSPDLLNHSATDRGLTGNRQTVVFKLTVAASTTTAHTPNLPKLVTVEEPGFNQIERELVISRKPCNFVNPEFVVMKPSDHSQGGQFFVRFNEPIQRHTSSMNAQDKIHLTTGVWFVTIRNIGAETSIYGVNDKTNLVLGIQSWKNSP